MKTVMVGGTFDIFHKGHEFFLKQARLQGDHLIVVVARDSTVEKVKGRAPKHSEQERKREVEDQGIADSVILGHEQGSIFDIIEEIRPSIICLGYDQRVSEEELRKRGITAEIKRLGSFEPETYKSSKLR